jgi:hypothetical protein
MMNKYSGGAIAPPCLISTLEECCLPKCDSEANPSHQFECGPHSVWVMREHLVCQKITEFPPLKESSKTRQKVQAFRDTTLFKLVVKCVCPSGRTHSQRTSPPVTQTFCTSRLAGGTTTWRPEQYSADLFCARLRS